MASQFDIEIKVRDPQSSHEETIIRVIDHDQDESTDFCVVELPSGTHSLEAIVAHAYRQHPSIANLLNIAKAVAHAVYLNEERLDLHGFLPRMEVLISHSELQSGTARPSAKPTPAPRI